MLTILMPLALLQQSPSEPPAAPLTPPACDTEMHAAFDFWVGEWEVTPNGSPERKVARSRIERKHNGCAVIETWMLFGGQGGTSLNHVDPGTGRWHQKWVGAAPGAVLFEGGPVDGKMVLSGYWNNIGGPGVHGLIRMTYSRREDGSVRQHGEQSMDHGLTWGPSFDFIYRPVSSEEK